MMLVGFAGLGLLAFRRSRKVPLREGARERRDPGRDHRDPAFYSGWPTASTALGIAREVFAAGPPEPTESTGAPNENA